ncbi:putative holin-like toxin [Lactococcus lactis subsp. hordniae]
MMDVAMLVIAACGFLISLLTFIVLLIEKIAKNKNRLTLAG